MAVCNYSSGSRYRSTFWSHPPTQPPKECERQMKSEIDTGHHTGEYVSYSFFQHELLNSPVGSFVLVPSSLSHWVEQSRQPFSEGFLTGKQIALNYFSKLPKVVFKITQKESNFKLTRMKRVGYKSYRQQDTRSYNWGTVWSDCSKPN